MVYFSCEDCGECLKKPKLQAHSNKCSATFLTCIDCNVTFSQRDAKGHNACVTEHQKYVEGATKPGGIAANGTSQNTGNATKQEEKSVAGEAYLATGRPWICRLCNVTCTSQETLLGHASGLKHIKRARARAKEEKANQAAPTNGTLENKFTGSEVSPLPENGIKLMSDKPKIEDEVPKEAKKRKADESVPAEELKLQKKSKTHAKGNETLETAEPLENSDLGLKEKKSKKKAKKLDKQEESGKVEAKAAEWEKEALALFLKLSRRDYGKFRQKLLKNLNTFDEKADTVLSQILENSARFSIDQDTIGLKI